MKAGIIWTSGPNVNEGSCNDARRERNSHSARYVHRTYIHLRLRQQDTPAGQVAAAGFQGGWVYNAPGDEAAEPQRSPVIADAKSTRGLEANLRPKPFTAFGAVRM
ncbi:MAG TPA: hypothetical protein VF006_17365 [Longimicrobium sp.]